MASIIERNGRYLFRVRMKGFQTVTKTFNKKADGVAWARRVETDMEAGRWTENLVQTPTFGEVLREYRQVVAPKFKGASTYRYRFDEFEALPFAPLPITPDGHFKFPHLWPVKLPRAGRPNYGSTAALRAMREAASLRR